jgi:hypothetical protein
MPPDRVWGRPPDEWARQSVVWASSLNHGSEPDALRSIDPPRLNSEPAGFATSLPASPPPVRLAGGSAARWFGRTHIRPRGPLASGFGPRAATGYFDRPDGRLFPPGPNSAPCHVRVTGPVPRLERCSAHAGAPVGRGCISSHSDREYGRAWRERARRIRPAHAKDLRRVPEVLDGNQNERTNHSVSGDFPAVWCDGHSHRVVPGLEDDGSRGQDGVAATR